MSDFRESSDAHTDTEYLNEEEFRSLIIGSSVRDVHRRPNGDIVIELSASRLLIIPNGSTGAHLQFDVQRNETWSAPIPVVIIRPSDTSFHNYTRAMVALQELYGIVLYINTNREDHLRDHFTRYPYADILDLLSGSDRLDFVSSGQGSWYAELIPKSKEAFKALFLVSISISQRGRELLFRRLEAETKIKELAVEKERIAVEKSEYEVSKERALAIREQLKTANTLIKFYQDHIAKLDQNDVIRLRFEREFGVLIGNRAALSLGGSAAP